MHHHEETQPDFGTGEKTLSVYLAGFVSCVVLTLVSFWAVMSGIFSKPEILTVIFISAIIQFIVQVVCFLRLNTQTEQAKANVMSFVFTLVILVCIVAGSLWIMWNLEYYMM